MLCLLHGLKMKKYGFVGVSDSVMSRGVQRSAVACHSTAVGNEGLVLWFVAECSTGCWHNAVIWGAAMGCVAKGGGRYVSCH